MLRKRCCLVVGENASDSDDSRKHDSEVKVVIRRLLVGACLLCYQCEVVFVVLEDSSEGLLRKLETWIP